MARIMYKVVSETQIIVDGQPHQLHMRIGIHTGSIIGGVIGTKTFRYDMWGSDVLIANQMENNGKPDHVVVSEATDSTI